MVTLVVAVFLAAFPTSRIPVVAATACVVPFLLDPAAVLGRMSPWHMKLRCVKTLGSCCSVPSWGVCGVHPPAPGRICVGTLLPACLRQLVLRPCVVAPPTNCVRFFAFDFAPSTCLRLILFCTCAQGRCGRCPPRSGVMSDLFFLFFESRRSKLRLLQLSPVH